MTKLSSQNRAPRFLAVLFTSGARVEVLRTFLIDPKRAYYQRQLETATGLPIRAIQRELEKLSESGLLYRRMEGRRAYYTIDQQFPGFDALRSLFLSDAEPLDRLRAELCIHRSVELAFLNSKADRVLVVVDDDGEQNGFDDRGEFLVEVISRSNFIEELESKPKRLEVFLKTGKDILGRREDMIWRRIETAGFLVEKGQGIP